MYYSSKWRGNFKPNIATKIEKGKAEKCKVES